MSDAVAADFRAEPWWWEAAPRDHSPPPPLPARADVAIVGSGYAGLAAAVTLARAGRHVVVLDAGAPGSAASSRSVGMVGGRLRQSPGALTAALGAEAATALMREANAAYGWFRDFVRDEGILCDLVRTGRLVCAWTARDLDRLRGLSRLLGERVGIESHVVDRAGLAREIATDLFHGALVLPGDGGVHPARLHDGLLQAARKAGAVVIPFTRVDGIDETAAGVELSSA
ncbi:MAG: NAD(P)/FAD-dependent oxidoreductase, partial [Alphaproteobacteria bacterium]